MSNTPDENMKHLDEMTLLLYMERQLDRARGLEVSAHTQECDSCRTLLRAMEREARLLTRAMLEEDEPLPSRLAQFQERARKSMQWIWGMVFGLAATGVYALYTTFILPLQQPLEQAGFGGSNLLGFLIFQGAMWKGWPSVIILFEVLAMVTLAGLVAMFFRRRIRRGSALALVFAGLCTMLALPAPASATEFRKGDSVTVAKEETIKGDAYITATRVRINGTVDGDLIVFCQSLDVSGHVTGDIITFSQSARITGQVDGNVRGANNNLTITGTIGKNVMSFEETLTLDPNGKIGGSLTSFAENVGADGSIGRDALLFFAHGSLAGKIGGGVRAKGRTLVIGSTAVIDGPVHFEGDKPPEVSSSAKLASPVEFKQMERKSSYREAHYYVWQDGAVLADAEVFAGCGEFGGTLWRRRRVGRSGALWRADRRVHRVHHRGRPVHRSLGVVPLVCVALFRADYRGRGDRAMADGPDERALAPDRANGRGASPRAAVHHDSAHRWLGQAGRHSLGYRRHFAGALSALPAGDCSRHTVCAVLATDSAEYDGRRRAPCVRKVINF